MEIKEKRADDPGMAGHNCVPYNHDIVCLTVKLDANLIEFHISWPNTFEIELLTIDSSP